MERRVQRVLKGLLVLAAGALVASGCGGAASTAQTSSVGASVQTKGQAAAPTGGAGKTYHMIVANDTCHDTAEKDARFFLSQVEQRSKGRIKGSLHSCSSLGNIREVLKGLQSNSIQAVGTPAVFLTAFVPQAGVINMPWLFPYSQSISSIVREESRVLKQGQYRTAMAKLVAQKGFHLVAMFGLSPEMFFSRTPIRDMAGFKGKKINVGAGKEHALMVKEWGGLPETVPIAQWYTSLQEGTLDAQETPPDVALHLKIQEVAPYVAVTKHAVMATVFVVSRKWYESLPASLQQVVDAAGAQLQKTGTANLAAAETKALQTLKSNPKVHVITFSSSQLQKMKQVNQQGVWKTIEKDPVRGPALKKLVADVSRYGG